MSTYIADQITKGYRVYDLKEIVGLYPSTEDIDEIINKLGPDKLGEIDENLYLYVKTNPAWKDILGRKVGKG